MSTSHVLVITNFFGAHVNAANAGVGFKNPDGSYSVSGTMIVRGLERFQYCVKWEWRSWHPLIVRGLERLHLHIDAISVVMAPAFCAGFFVVRCDGLFRILLRWVKTMAA